LLYQAVRATQIRLSNATFFGTFWNILAFQPCEPDHIFCFSLLARDAG